RPLPDDGRGDRRRHARRPALRGRVPARDRAAPLAHFWKRSASCNAACRGLIQRLRIASVPGEYRAPPRKGGRVQMVLSLRSGRRRGGLLLAALLAVLAAAGILAAVATASSSGKSAKSNLIVLEEEIAPTIDPDGPNGAQPQTQEMIDNLMDPLVTYHTS